MENLIEQQVKGYEIVERIGVGGFGAVYRAYQPGIEREVAIKVILPEVSQHPDFIRRFEAEAQMIARLEHINIVPLYDYWRDSRGTYLVMRWLRGGSLADRLKQGAIEIEVTGKIMVQIASALMAAHQSNIIHRDIKPANILQDEEGNAYLSDFGIAKDANKIDGSVTGADTIIGSLDYISPEQARSENVTPKTDIYSLGVVLYEMLTGEHPFPNLSSVERFYKHINDPLPDITGLPLKIIDAVNQVIQKATAKKPADRYDDVLAFADAFLEAAHLKQQPMPERLVEILTPREQEVLQLMVNGLSNKEIADKLVVTLNSIKSYQSRIYRKLGVKNRVQAIARGRELDLLYGDAAMPQSLLDASSTVIATLPEPENPYKGLHAFQSADSQDFFGREAITRKLIDRLKEKDQWQRFLAVVGPSGSGKSSLVRAGLIPAIWRGELPGSDRWFTVEMLPGSNPLDELEVALLRVSTEHSGNLKEHLERDARGLLRATQLILPDDDYELVLIVDQLEEVFTLVEDEAQCEHFLDLLFTAANDQRSCVRIIVTLRADFYDRPLRYPDFGEMLRTRMETILPLSADELERAIVNPAARVGVKFEEGLVPTIIDEVSYQPGALPLLQYALTELFERCDKRTLTHQAYSDMGGTVGALAKRADVLFAEFDDAGREAVHQMFLRLVTLGEGIEDTRRRTPREELRGISDDPDLMDEVIDTYAAYRLLSLDHDPASHQPMVEVAHEAILREWERLRHWIDEAREEIRMQQQLARMAEEWYEAERDISFLASGLRLEQLEAWMQETDLALTQTEREFLNTSIAEHERRQAAELARQQHENRLERRSQRLLRGLLAVFALAAVIAIGLSIFAFDRERQAQDARQKAEREASVNHSLVLANDAVLANKTNNDLALLLALEAIGIDDPPSEAMRALQSVAFSLGKRAILSDSGNKIRAVAFSPDSRWALSAGCATLADDTCTESQVILWDVENAVEQCRFHGPAAWANAVRFESTGQAAAVAYDDGTIIMWDIQTGSEIRRFEGEHIGSVNALAVSPDGAFMVTGGADHAVILWEIASGQVIQRFDDHTDAVSSVAFNHDGTRFASGSVDTTIRLWDREAGSLILHLEGHPATVQAMAFRPGNVSREETLISAAQVDLREWDLETGNTRRSFEMACAGFGIAMSPDGQMLATTNCVAITMLDLENWVWNDRAIATESLEALAISPDGRYLIAGQINGYLELFNMPVTGEVRRFEADVPLMSAGLSPDGRYLLTGSFRGGVAILWDTQSGEEIRRFENQAGTVAVVGFSPDGQRAVIGSGDVLGATRDRRLVLVDVETGEEIHELEGHEFGLRTHAFSPDGRQLLTGSIMFGAGWADVEEVDSGDLILWDVQTGRRLRRFEDSGAIFGIEFSANGRYAYTTNLYKEITRVWELSTGQEIDRFFGRVAVERGLEEDTLLTDLKLVDPATGKVIRSFSGSNQGAAMAMDVSPDGRYLISGDGIHNVILWDYATGEEIRQLPGHTTTVMNAFFSPDGQTAYAAAYAAPVIQWRVADWPLDELLDWVHENRYIREFTCEEREQYRIEPVCEEEG